MNTRRDILNDLVRLPGTILVMVFVCVYLFFVVLGPILLWFLGVLLPCGLLWAASPLIGLIKPSWGHAAAQPWINSDDATDRFFELMLAPLDRILF